jgi:hypothetical protein
MFVAVLTVLLPETNPVVPTFVVGTVAEPTEVCNDALTIPVVFATYTPEVFAITLDEARLADVVTNSVAVLI